MRRTRGRCPRIPQIGPGVEIRYGESVEVVQQIPRLIQDLPRAHAPFAKVFCLQLLSRGIQPVSSLVTS